MKKYFYVGSWLIMLLVTGGVIARFVFLGDTSKADHTGRVGINMTTQETDFVLAEMRDFLAGIQVIHAATLTEDRKAIANAAAPLGRSVADHAPAGLIGKLPIGFKQLGFAVHDDFDRIGRMANTASMRQIQEEMSTALSKCVACHASYRINTLPQ